jgi:predicted MFS family arabinose efflux permease
MATAALFTCMMDWCSADAAATDYTVQASAVVIATGIASAVAGFSAQALGYVAHFALASVLAAAALLVVRAAFPTPDVERSLRGEPAGAAGAHGEASDGVDREVAPCA